MATKPFVLSVKALIRDEKSRYLVVRRSRQSLNNGGLWDFPGGKIDPGESFDQALLREIAEETGLQVELTRVLGAGESELTDRKVAYIFLEAQLKRGDVRLSDEHEEFAWLRRAELDTAELCPQFRELAHRLAATGLSS